MNSTESVSVKRDDGKGRQWGLGKWFYRQDGGKNRLNTKSAGLVALFLFAVVLIFSMLKETDDIGGDQKSKISAPEANTDAYSMTVPQAETLIEQVRVKAEVASSNYQLNGQASNAAQLQKVERFSEQKIPPGTLVEAMLTSGASDGPVRAILIEDLLIGGESAVERGTILVGQGVSSEDRLLVQFTHLVSKEGSYQRIEATGCDYSDKMPGLKGTNARGQALKLTGAIALGLVGGTAQGMQRPKQISNPQSSGPGASPPEEPTMRDAVLNGLATTSLDQARSLSTNLSNTKPLYEVADGTKLFVMFAGD